ncbi:MAG: hypothetical protein ACLUNZ_12565 [Evtepia sp.]
MVKTKIAVLVSGGGTNLQALLDAQQSGALTARGDRAGPLQQPQGLRPGAGSQRRACPCRGVQPEGSLGARRRLRPASAGRH